MANFDQLKQSVAALIRTNGAEEITGQIMQDVLLTIINSISGGYMFGGVAQHSGNVGNPDYNVFYLAGSGAYTGYGDAINIPNGCYGVFRYNGSWTQDVVDIGVHLTGTIREGETNGVTGDVINTALQQLFNNVMNILDTLTFTYNTPSAQQATKAMLDVIMTPTGGASHVLTTLTLVSATAAAAGLMSAEDKRKVDRMLTDFRSLSFSDTTAVADQATKIVQTLSATLGENPEAITTMTFLAATASKAGLLSAADKAKLDALWSSGYQFAGIATPSTTPVSTTSKIFYIATEAGTYFNAVTVTQGINLLSWNGTSWSAVQVVGIDDEPTAGSDNLVKSGGVQTELALGAVYDVSAHHNGATFESLSALLSDTDLNALIPTAVRKGGMSIKFVQSSDNKYVQYRLKTTSFSIDEEDWQRVDGLFPLYRNSVSSFQYPYNVKNTISDTYAKGIIELYIDPIKYSSNDIRLRTFRNGHTSSLWEGKRYEICINDGTSEILNTERYNITPSSAEFIHNSDWSVCVIVNWLALEDNIGYGANYASSPDTTLSEKVKDLKNSLVIQRILEDKNLKSLIDNNSVLITTKQDLITPNNVIIVDNLDSYLINGSINNDGTVSPNTSYRSLRGVLIPSGAKSVLVKNDVDTLSNMRFLQYDANDNIIKKITDANWSNKFVVFESGAVKFDLTLISGYYDHSKGTNYDTLAAWICNNILFYPNTSGAKITKINGYALSIPELEQDVQELEQDVQQNINPQINSLYSGNLLITLNPIWEVYGITGSGGLNNIDTQSHCIISNITKGCTLKFSKDAYRINLYKGDRFVVQTDFRSGSSYTLPDNVDYDTIWVSREMPASVDSNVSFKYQSYLLTQQLINTKQDYISGNATTIDKSLYTQEGAISYPTGLLEPHANRRSLVDFPVSYGTNYLIINNVDTESGKKISFWKENNVLSRVIDVVDMTHYILTCHEDEVKANITLISAYGEQNVSHYNEIEVYDLGSDTELKISKINNIPIIPDNSADLEQHLQANNPHHISASMIGALSGVKVNGSLLEKDGTVVSLPDASPTAGGMMSKEDKSKLDNIVNPGTINISGSGVTKNASAFGFLPTKTAAENVTALQSAVTGGGTILVDYPGTYLVNDTILLDSNTTIIFGAGVYISLQADKRFLLNRGALTKEYNENISIVGLNIITNNHGVEAVVSGLRGYIAFFYIKHLYIDRFTLLDGASGPYVIHICTFEDIKLTNLHIEGYKDAVHIGRGSKFVIRNGIFKTYDDPIALNAHDYPSGQPEYGWIEDGIIENCYDLADPDRGTTGYFARILAGSWSDWASGNEYQINGDLCVSNNRLYQTTANMSTQKIVSTSQPNHASGSQTYPDGLTWRMVQDSGVGYSCGCRRVHFKDIFLQKPRGTAFSIHFDNDGYSRSYYPNSTPPVQEDLIFENIFFEAEIGNLISCVTPINIIKLINSILQNSKINLTKLNVTGITYIPTHIIMIGTTFKGSGNNVIAQSASGRDADIKILGSVVDSNNFTPSVSNVTVISNDIGL